MMGELTSEQERELTAMEWDRLHGMLYRIREERDTLRVQVAQMRSTLEDIATLKRYNPWRKSTWQMASDALQTNQGGQSLLQALRLSERALSQFKTWHSDSCAQAKDMQNDCDCERVDVFRALEALAAVGITQDERI